jgi:Damage-control phosphatase ARMT1-like domain
MKCAATPRLPVPPPLCSDVPGTWAFDTMSSRIRTDILARIFRENDFSPATLSRLTALDAELQNAANTPLTPIDEDGGRDVAHWNSVILADALASRATWLSAPWALAEFYFYRRVMTAVAYFHEPVDPFAFQKQLGLSSSMSSMQTLSVRLNSALNVLAKDMLPDFLRFVVTALWGNRSKSRPLMYLDVHGEYLLFKVLETDYLTMLSAPPG